MMWRLYAYPVSKFFVLALVPFAAWYLAVWIRGGDFGLPFVTYRGMSTDFLGLFLIILIVGVGIVGFLFWGGPSKAKDSRE